MGKVINGITEEGKNAASIASLTQQQDTRFILDGIYKNSNAQYMDIYIDDQIAYCAMDYGGVQKLDVSLGAAPSLLVNNDIAPEGMQTYGIAKDGDYVFAASRTAGGDYLTDASIALRFDNGVADLSEGGDGWDSGYASAGVSVIGNAPHSPFGNKFGGRTSWINLEGSADGYVQKAITGDVDNYAMFWLKVDAPTADNLAVARINVFAENANAVYKIVCSHRTDNNMVIQMVMYDSVNASVTVTASKRLEYDTWYLMKCYYKIDSTTGGGYLKYKANIADNWTTLCEKLDFNTTGKTPTLLRMGLYTKQTGAGYKTGGFNYDEVMFDTTDLDNLVYDEGKVDVLNASDLQVIDTVWFDGKCSDIYKLGDWLLVSLQKRGVAVIDATDPTDLQVLGHWGDPTGTLTETQGIFGFTIDENKYAVVANYWKGLSILNVTDPTNIVRSSVIDFIDSYATDWDVFVEYPYAYCSKSLNAGSAVGGENDFRGLAIYDITDPENPIAYEYEFPDEIKDTFTAGDGDPRPAKVAKSGNYVYLANGTKGVAIYDVTDPTDAEYVKSIPTPTRFDESIWAVTMDEYDRLFVGGGRHTGGDHNLYIWRKI